VYLCHRTTSLGGSDFFCDEQCDERKPTCRKCIVHGVECSFAGLASSRGSTASDTSREPAIVLAVSPTLHAVQLEAVNNSHGPTTLLTPTPPVLPPPALALSDLELLHHYTTSTAYTLSRSPLLQKVWRVKAPQIGFSSPFVLHALLAVSALHMMHLDPARCDYFLSQAQTHHDAAVATVAPIVPSLATENSAALFLFSSLTCIFSCGKPRTEDDFLFLEQGRVADWVRFFRGTKAIMDHGGAAVTSGALAPLFVNRTQIALPAAGSGTAEDGETYVWGLKQMIRNEVKNPAHQTAYLDALDEMSKSFAAVMGAGEERMVETADVFSWLLGVSDEYLDLLGLETPFALITFAYFCILLKRVEWMWWLRGLSEKLMSELTPGCKNYAEWLQWPQEEIGWAPPNA
jgi:hypothetical protein